MPGEIRNKLEILPGNVIRVPGCEPVSSFTSLALAANVNCNASIISLDKAVEAIPDATIERVLRPSGFPGTGQFFVLPEGPPTRPGCNSCDIMEDYYQKLRDAAEPIEFEEDDEFPDGVCAAAANWTRCRTEQDQFHRAPDPTLRPNSTPLGGTGT
jgi:hypothetical protein